MDPTDVVPQLPQVPEPATAPAASPAPPAGPELAGQVASPAQPGRFRAWWDSVKLKLTSPTPHKPADYHDRRSARFANDLVDGRGIEGPARKAQWGESVALVLDHTMGARGGAMTPLGHLGGATIEMAYNIWDSAPQRAAALAAAEAAEREANKTEK